MGLPGQLLRRSLVALLLAFSGGGCEHIALVGRESLKLGPTELVAQVERLDRGAKQIHLGSNSEGITTIAYNDDTRVLFRGRELQPDDLLAGDVIAVSVKEGPAGQYSGEFITIRERSDEPNRTP
jgi:hypothetical protein